MAVKEHIAVEGLSLWPLGDFERYTAEQDSIAVERLRKAGAVIIGNTIQAVGLDPWFNTDLESQPRNPWNTELVPGRSEEHTSELQSLMRISYAVFCLKKKKSYNATYKYTNTLLATNTSLDN